MSVSMLRLLAAWAACCVWLAHCRIRGSSVQLLSTREEFTAFLASHPKVLVDFVSDSNMFDRMASAELDRAITILKTSGVDIPLAKVVAERAPDLSRTYVPDQNYPQLVWFLGGQPTKYHHQIRDGNQIANFMLILNRDPVIRTSGKDAALDMFNKVFYLKTMPGSRLYAVAETVGKNFLDRVAVMYIESTEHTGAWIDTEGAETRYDGELSETALERWFRARLTMSEEVPAEMEEGEAVPVVANSFDEVVMENDKDVFMMIYAPWCGYCRKLSPTWEQVARATKDIPHIVVAKMDGTRNGSPYPELMNWDAYPTVYYFRNGEKQGRMPRMYTGERDLEGLLQYIKSQYSRPEELTKMNMDAEEL